ncbi:MAG: CCA tRNA nucleotidyltransferase [Actinobacteria bacterium]|nr:CCA tRNA nucleotidyltransferase [Actinomycetota bacterium]
MDERVEEILHGEDAWIVGGAVRDLLLGRPVVDLDVAFREPRDAAHRFARRYGGAAFPLSERHGAWRVASSGSDETVDFTPLPSGIEVDLATRDFTFNAIAIPVGGGDPVDPHGGRADLEARIVRAVSDGIFRDDPIRLLRAVRLEDELDFRMDERTEALLRVSTELVSRPAGERTLAELRRMSPAGYRRLEEVGLLEPLGGSLDGPFEALDDSDFRLVAVFGESLARLPISRNLQRYSSVLLRARGPDDTSARAIHRFRRSTEPWALHALAFLDATGFREAVEEARRMEPREPLVRGDELGLPPGPEIGRILALIEEERAAGTIATRDEALTLARAQADEEGSK